MFCKYCQKPAKSERSKQQHEIRCKSNPDAIKIIPSYGMAGKKGANQFTYGGTVSDETRKKLSDSTTRLNKERWAKPEMRLKQSESMKLAVKNHPESYTSSNRGRIKQFIVDGIKLQGQWEVDFYKWAKDKGLNPVRPTEGFKYIWNGERTYYPDFYIESLDLYVEVKGYETERDRSKWLHFPKKLRIIREIEIKQIRKGIFERL
jgi:hypothetical protein